MDSRLPRRALLAVLAITVAGLSACGARTPLVDPDYRAAVESWRARREAGLTAEDGWLSLVGLHWLEPGDTTFGSAPNAGIVLTADGVPPIAGTLTLDDDGTVTADCPVDSGVTIAGEAIGERVVRSDAGGVPDVFELGRLRFHLIQRSDRVGVRVKDPESPTRRAFTGLEYFPINPDLRVVAHLEPYDPVREIPIATVIGTEEIMLAPGRLVFAIDGEELSIDPLVADPTETDLFIIIRDLTSGTESYGAGRFLSASLEPDGTTVLDFNRAVNPPCAFSPYATCPLPPPQNALNIEVRAGEKKPTGTGR